MNKFLASLAAGILAMTGLAGMAHAQSTQTEPGVARVSLIRGNVSMQRGDTGDWIAVTVNTPLLSGDSISTGPNSRTSVQLNYANILRLDSNSTVKIANLGRKNIQVQVAQGLVNYDVLMQDQAQAEIDTPSVAIHPLDNGRYRIEVDPNNQTLVTVYKGEAEISTPQGSTQVKQGQMITVHGISNPQYRVSSAPAEDAWDHWNQERDRSILDSSAWQHTDRYYTGAQDLGSYGHWVYAPDYGWIWTPYGVGPGWSPYSVGRWTWEPYYGWTWVSYEPWGWAPFHYGRWFLYAGNWSWWPGPVNIYPAYYPVWAPAYVSFFGWGSGVGFSFGFGFGNVGWLPIGPADPYYPWYGGYGFNVFNVNNFYNIRHDYDHYHGWGPLYRRRGGYSNFGRLWTDAKLRRGISWMRASQFGRGAVPRQRRMINDAEFRHARMFGGRVPVMPTRASLRVVNHAANPASFRRGLVRNQRFFTAGHPTPRPVSFTEQRSRLQRTFQNYRTHNGFRTANGRPADANPRVRGANGRPTRAFSTTGKVNSRGGFRTFNGRANGRPTPAQRGRRNAQPAGRAKGAPAQQNGWHVFGQVGRSRGNSPGSHQGGTARTGANRSGGRPAFGNRTFHAPARSGNGRGPAQRQGWKVFTPHSQQPRNARPSGGARPGPGGRQSGWHVFRPSQRPSQGRGGRPSGRQPLNLRQPIVRRGPSGGHRNYGGRNFGGGAGPGRAPAYRQAPRRGNYGGYGGGGRAPAYHAPAYHAPAYRAPRGGHYGGYSGGGRAPAYHAPARAPRGGGGFRGGRSHGGGSHGGGHGHGH